MALFPPGHCCQALPASFGKSEARRVAGAFLCCDIPEHRNSATLTICCCVDDARIFKNKIFEPEPMALRGESMSCWKDAYPRWQAWLRRLIYRNRSVTWVPVEPLPQSAPWTFPAGILTIAILCTASHTQWCKRWLIRAFRFILWMFCYKALAEIQIIAINGLGSSVNNNGFQNSFCSVCKWMMNYEQQHEFHLLRTEFMKDTTYIHVLWQWRLQ